MDAMPAFDLPSSAGGSVSNKSLAGKAYVLYFYPKDDTPGCTTEACDFRDNLARLHAKGLQVFGVSPDNLASHAKFIAKHDLSFPLLSDEDHALAEQLGAWGEKNMYGKKSFGIIRSTFLINAKGQIAHAWRKVKVDGHVAAVLAAVEAL
jgi:peroxiredoxin Q/BCP